MRKRTDGMEPRFVLYFFHSLIFPFETRPSPGGDPRRSPAAHQLKEGGRETSRMEEDKASHGKRDFVLSLFFFPFFILFVVREEDNEQCVYVCVWV